VSHLPQPSAETGTDLAGSLPLFPGLPGDDITTSLRLADFRAKRLLFNRLGHPGQIHVYSGECRAGERLRAQLFVPLLPLGGAVAPSFALIAQSLPYSADVDQLPIELPAGFSAVVAAPPNELNSPTRDALTGVNYYPGPIIDTRTLVSGRCYLVVWSPRNHMGKYVMQVGHRWPWRWTYWTQILRFWWQIRGWFGLDRTAAYVLGAGALIGGFLVWRRMTRRRRLRPDASDTTA
jgi:hypothetical protein